MNFTYCILFCLLATTLVESNDTKNTKDLDISYRDLTSFVDRSYNKTIEQCHCQSTLVESQKNVNLLKSLLRAIIDVLFYPPLVYNNKIYLISNFPHNNVAQAMTFCTALGGYLTEIDDNDEYKALKNFVLNAPPDIVIIGGSDAAIEGTWIFPRTGLRVKILDWAPSQPDNLGNEDCLNLWKRFGAKFNDIPCGFRNAVDRFMCEIPNYF